MLTGRPSLIPQGIVIAGWCDIERRDIGDHLEGLVND